MPKKKSVNSVLVAMLDKLGANVEKILDKDQVQSLDAPGWMSPTPRWEQAARTAKGQLQVVRELGQALYPHGIFNGLAHKNLSKAVLLREIWRVRRAIAPDPARRKKVA